MRKQVGAWQGRELSDITAKMVIYEAFAEGKASPEYEEFRPRTNWSLSNSFTSASRDWILSRNSRPRRR